jgi:hypothetical protein
MSYSLNKTLKLIRDKKEIPKEKIGEEMKKFVITSAPKPPAKEDLKIEDFATLSERGGELIKELKKLNSQ